MDRSQKEAFVKEFATEIGGAEAMAVMSFDKITVEQMTSFRLSLAKQNVRVQVVKNTLAKRVFNETPLKGLSQHFKGPTLVAYSTGDAVVTAKAVCEWLGKENFDVKIKAGSALGQEMSEAQIKIGRAHV